MFNLNQQGEISSHPPPSDHCTLLLCALHQDGGISCPASGKHSTNSVDDDNNSPRGGGLLMLEHSMVCAPCFL